jgi:hypothetical protein
MPRAGARDPGDFLTAQGRRTQVHVSGASRLFCERRQIDLQSIEAPPEIRIIWMAMEMTQQILLARLTEGEPICGDRAKQRLEVTLLAAQRECRDVAFDCGRGSTARRRQVLIRLKHPVGDDVAGVGRAAEARHIEEVGPDIVGSLM